VQNHARRIDHRAQRGPRLTSQRLRRARHKLSFGRHGRTFQRCATRFLYRTTQRLSHLGVTVAVHQGGAGAQQGVNAGQVAG